MTEILILMPALNTPAWWRMGCVLGCVLSFGVPGKEVGMPPWGRGKRGMPPRADRGGKPPRTKGSAGDASSCQGQVGGCLPMRGRKKRGCLPAWGWGGGKPQGRKSLPFGRQSKREVLPGPDGLPTEGASGGKIINWLKIS